MGARWYDPSIGRFVQPDTIIPDLYNPQDLNRYAYVRNNPLRYTDPSGFDPLDEEWENDFIKEHGNPPDDQDRRDRLFSLMFAGSGENGAWTLDDWKRYNGDRDNFWNGQSNWPGSPPPSLDRFNDHLTTLGSYYQPNERDQFVRATGLVWASIPTTTGLQGVGDVIWVATHAANVNATTPFLFEGDAGWNPYFTDNYASPAHPQPDRNPSHHAAAFFYTGYFYGTDVAVWANNLRDWDNIEDMRLGNSAASVGNTFAWGFGSISSFGRNFTGLFK
jgi:hypothetical protein